MYFTVDIRGQLLPLLAPVGAAAYHVKVKGDHVSILFAMQREGEWGIDTLKRIRRDQPTMNWVPTAARPVNQAPMAVGEAEFLSYDFKYEEGVWTPVNPTDNNFFEMMSRVAAVAMQAPSAFHTTLEDWRKANT